jgi:AAA15 family ATPase/GTPase
MPKSRHRKNHKKKATSFKQRTVDKVKSTNKEIMKIQEDLQEAWKKKQEESKKEDEPINLNPETL